MTSRASRTWLPLVLAALLLASPRLDGQTDGFEWEGRLPSGAWLHLYSGDGAIDVVAWDQDHVRVVGQTRGIQRGQDRVRFETVRVGENVVVCAAAAYVECRPDGLHLSDRQRSHRPEEARFTAYVPRDTHVRVNTGVGEVTVEGTGGDVEARTGNGRVVVLGTSSSVSISSGNGALEIHRATGAVRARTSNGPITIHEAGESVSARSDNGPIQVGLASLARNEGFEFRTANGPIVLSLPRDQGFQLTARLNQGEVISDLPITIAPRADGPELRASFGQGGPHLIAISGSGDLFLRRARR